MRSVVCIALIAICFSAAGADDPCPCVATAKELGASKEQLATITKLRNEMMAEFGKLAEKQEYKDAVATAKAAAKDKDQKRLAAAQQEISKLQKPAFEAFHKGAAETLGKELYEKYNKKLPEWAKVS